MSSQADVAENLNQAERLLRRASELGAQICVLPEAFAFLGNEQERARHAEAFSSRRALPRGRVHEALSRFAQQGNFWLVAGGAIEQSSDPARPYNTSLVMDPHGKVRERYRKIHLFDVVLAGGTSYQESSATSPGDRVVVAEALGHKVGLSICYDLRFPMLFAQQRLQGAEILTVPAAFTAKTGQAHWELLLRARAVETQCFVIAAAQVGSHPLGRRTFGHAMVVDGWGSKLAECNGETPGLAVAELDFAAQARVRQDMPLAASERDAL